MAAVLAMAPCITTAEQPLNGAQTGPTTESRLPPLVVPQGFKATLFACDPLVEYLSAVALGPRPGSLFVAADYMTGLGTDIVRRDEIRLIEDTDGDGYADKSTTYADGFNSIMGLTYHGGTLFVMHSPLLTALGDTDGDGKADQRRDLLTGLGLSPEENPVRLHCANGLVMGHDGWLYLALGDHGCNVLRPEGDRLVHEGGGILRCRPDGHDLHVFARGLRNIYDVVLDEELNVFVRDNENDGGTYKIRVCHSFFGADHGYPYLYDERPDEALPPLADLGLGSSAGGLCYLERQFPAEYRGNLFFCEWGKSVVRCAPKRAGAGFAPLTETEFATGAENDPYGFKPTDLVIERDGSLIVVDWCDGQRPKRGRGRIYRIAYSDGEKEPAGNQPQAAGIEDLLAQLDSDSYYRRVEAQLAIEKLDREGLAVLRGAVAETRLGARGRMHAVWVLAHADGPAAVDDLFDLAATDPEPSVQVQAIRAIGDLTDPVMTRHRLDAQPGDAEVAERLATYTQGKETRVLVEVVIALGRLRWQGVPDWLAKVLTDPDRALSHAVMQTLRRSQNWPAVLPWLERPTSRPLRALALRAIADEAAPELVDGLLERLRKDSNPVRQLEYVDLLTRVHRKPGAWTYWGYRPAPRPPNTIDWERTEAIEQALDSMLGAPDRMLRLSVLRRMQREKITTRFATLSAWLRDETEEVYLHALLESLGEHKPGDTRELFDVTIRAGQIPTASRLTALAAFAAGLDEASEARLLALAGSLEDGVVLAESIRQLGKRPALKAAPLLLEKLNSSEPQVRVAALEAVTVLKIAEAAQPVRRLLADRDAGVRRAAATAAGQLGDQAANTALLELAKDADSAVRRASLESLTRLKEPRAVPLAVAALADSTTESAALACLADLGGPPQAGDVVELAKRNPSAEVLPQVLRMLTAWAARPGANQPRLDDDVAEIQGGSGTLARWRATGPLPAAAAARLAERFTSAAAEKGLPDGEGVIWKTVFATDTESRIALDPADDAKAGAAWLALTDVSVGEPTEAQFLGGTNGALRIWLNGRLVHEFDQAAAPAPGSDRFDARLGAGTSRVVVHVSAVTGNPVFQLRFRRKTSTAEHERLTQAALTKPGNAEHGRALFFNAERSQCVKCHRIADQGERIGPELTGVGNRFSRIHLVESVLQPSRTIAPSFQAVTIVLSDGRSITGIAAAEDERQLTLADNQGKKHVLEKSDIEARQPQAVSVMPEGLEKPFSLEEFVDLIAFLASQKDRQ